MRDLKPSLERLHGETPPNRDRDLTMVFAVDRQGGAYYSNLWQGAIATRPAFVMITSWNEWMEGHQIEPGRSYGDLYLQLTRDESAVYRASLTG